MSGVLQTKIGGLAIPKVPLPNNLIVPKINNNALPSGFNNNPDSLLMPTGAVDDAAVRTKNDYDEGWTHGGYAGNHSATTILDASNVSSSDATHNVYKSVGFFQGTYGNHYHYIHHKFYNEKNYRYFNAMKPDGLTSYNLPKDSCFFVTNLTDYNKFIVDGRFAKYDGTQDSRGASVGSVALLNATTDYSSVADAYQAPDKSLSEVCNGTHFHTDPSDFTSRYHSTDNSTNGTTKEVFAMYRGGGDKTRCSWTCGGNGVHKASNHAPTNVTFVSSSYKKFDVFMFIVLPEGGVNVESGMSFVISDSNIPTGYSKVGGIEKASMFLKTDSDTSNIGTAYDANNMTLSVEHQAGSYIWTHNHFQYTPSGSCGYNEYDPKLYVVPGNEVHDAYHANENHNHTHSASTYNITEHPLLYQSWNIYVVTKD